MTTTANNEAAVNPTTANGRLVRDLLAAMGRMDIESVSSLLADDASWWLAGDLPVSGLYEGRAAIVGEFLVSAATLFEPDSLGFEVRSFLEQTDAVVVEYAGTGRGSLGGHVYQNSYCTVFECRDGRISAVREYLDTAHVRDALYRR